MSNHNLFAGLSRYIMTPFRIEVAAPRVLHIYSFLDTAHTHVLGSQSPRKGHECDIEPWREREFDNVRVTLFFDVGDRGPPHASYGLHVVLTWSVRFWESQP